MTDQDIESTISEAYVNAIAARAGVGLRPPSRRDYGIDGTFCEIQVFEESGHCSYIECGASINYQLKASINCNVKDKVVVYSIKKAAYNRLVHIKNNSAAPCILLVLRLPRDKNQWLSVCEDSLLIRHCCYWLKWEETVITNKSAVPIEIPRENVFTPEELLNLFEKCKKGELR